MAGSGGWVRPEVLFPWGKGIAPEEVRHASRNADSACPLLYWQKKGTLSHAFRDACRTSSGVAQDDDWPGRGKGCGLEL